MKAKAWIDNNNIKCMSMQCIINSENNISLCPRFSKCKDYDITLKESEVIMMCEQNTIPADEMEVGATVEETTEESTDESEESEEE